MSKTRKFTIIALLCNFLLFIVAIIMLVYLILLGNQVMDKTLLFLAFGILALGFGSRAIFYTIKICKKSHSETNAVS
ncbi:hypothetical protein SH601_08730 [Gracilibacillus sp. S3-1-1]|uniref:Uncharacterized protein n=1 Tax=Gracilibacillus pellucidus TaxID=3095368 RepID=A0ACC6M5J0_9BACI|nr:hypothetical protein [Gracilibacillus sp. S3-1-1]MDX8046072.1 hypothetical protein [Gracilibacillus sp. S3-1-1]